MAKRKRQEAARAEEEERIVKAICTADCIWKGYRCQGECVRLSSEDLKDDHVRSHFKVIEEENKVEPAEEVEETKVESAADDLFGAIGGDQ